MKITSLQNDKVKYWVSLKEKKNRDLNKEFLIEGDHLINEAKKFDLIKETISINENDNADYIVTEDIMKKISCQKSICERAAIVKFIPDKEPNGNILVLDNIQDPGNLGTIIRSSIAFNFKTIILSDTSVDEYNPKVIRSTEGMIFHQNILRKNLINYLPILKDKGYTIVGTDVINGHNIKEIPKDNICLVIGSEGKGMSPEIKSLCDTFAYINMNNNCESLNAGVAASILMYEVNNE